MKLQINHEKLLHNLSVGIIAFNDDAEITYANQKAVEWLGLICEIGGQNYITPKDWQIVDKFGDPLPYEQYPGYLAAHSPEPVENYEIGVFNPRENKRYWFLCDAYKSPSEIDDVNHYVVTFTNITAQKEHIPFKDIVEHANDVVIVSDASSLEGAGPSIVYVNKAFSRLTGFSAEEAIGSTAQIVQGEKTSPVSKKRIADQLSAGKSVREEMINYTKDGLPYWVDVNIVPLVNPSGVITHYAAIERDITALKDKTFNLEKLAKTDALTELLNRRGLEQDGQRFIDTAVNNDRTFILAIMDIDHFKAVNDTHGHDVGDIILKELADTLVDNLRARDVVARFGGEEFVVMLQGEPLMLLIQKIHNLRALIEKTEFYINESLTIKLTCSFGVAAVQSTSEATQRGFTLTDLLKNSDVALYESKRNGRNRVTTNTDFCDDKNIK